MNAIPLPLTNARTAAQAMYRKYSAQADLIEDGKSTDREMLNEQWQAVRLLESQISLAYDCWQLVGGESSTHSITALAHCPHMHTVEHVIYPNYYMGQDWLNPIAEVICRDCGATLC
jgi:hypothetical protein